MTPHVIYRCQTSLVRADRLLTVLLMLRHAKRLTAREMAARLEVSERTVLRDIDALATAGIPVYAERGRNGGFALLPGWSTDLTGLTGAEARALLAAGSRATAESLGMAPALKSGLRKLLSSMPEQQQEQAAQAAARVLVRSEGFLSDSEDTPALGAVQEAVFANRRLRFRYRSGHTGNGSTRTVDPQGLVNAGGVWYLIATHRKDERTFRISRMSDPVVLPDPSQRPTSFNLDEVWQRRRSEFRQGGRLAVDVNVAAHRRPSLVHKALALRSEEPGTGGWLRLGLDFGDRDHAVAVLWSMAADIEVLRPVSLRRDVAELAKSVLAAHTRVDPRSAIKS